MDPQHRRPHTLVVLAAATAALASCASPRRDDAALQPILSATAPLMPDHHGAASDPGPGDLAQSALAATAAPEIAPDAAPIASVPPCPAPYTCDFNAWERAPKPTISEILVQKGPHRLHLVAGSTVVRSYTVALGYGGAGPKKYEGDGVTPVGTYAITDRLDSKWHTFLGVNYPSVADQREFPLRKARGEVPPGKGIGFGIAIHGHRKDQADGEHKKLDWTLGCIALDNQEIDEVAAVVKRGTRLVITD
jgi:L,D-peptidoglycan transpeptidase YkuD (ErfK/YbiS/YcfS/YnhG family)